MAIGTDLIKQRIQESMDVKADALADENLIGQTAALAESICQSLRNGGKVLFAGNGGSFSDSIHLAAEFVSRFTMERAPLAAVALGANNSILTAIGNDYTFGDVFIREIRALGRPGDVFVGLSTSGNSENIIRAVEAAREIGIETVCLTGETGGRLAGLCACIKAPSKVTARIQETHITLGHIICELAERTMFEGQNNI